MKRPWLAVCLLACLLIEAAAAQATLTVNAPPDRLALPGDFVTLVFRVTSSVSGTVRLDITSEHGYPLLKPPDTLTLRAGVTGMVPITMEVPSDAPALTVDRVSVTAALSGQRVAGTTHVTVGEKRGVRMQAPAEVPLSGGKFTLTLINRGNVEEAATVQVSRGGETLASRDETLLAGASVPVTVTVREAGTYQATLLVANTVHSRALVKVIKEGVPAPQPIMVKAEVSGSLDTNSNWGFGVRLNGPLSDYVTTTAALLADQPARSFWTLDAEHWQATAGALAYGPLRLPLPGGMGLRAAYRAGPLMVGAGAAWVTTDHFAGYAFGGRVDGDRVVAAAAGLHSGAPLAAFRVDAKRAGTGWRASGSLLDGDLSAQGEVSAWDRARSATSSLDLQASHLLSNDGTVHVAGSYSDPLASLYGSVDVPVGAKSSWGGRLGVTARMPTAIPGRTSLSLQGGSSESFATVDYAARFAGGWSTSDRLGAGYDANGFGVRMSTSWSVAATPLHTMALVADVIYHPNSQATSGRVSARYATALGPASVSAAGSWDLSSDTVDLGLATVWSTSASELQATADVGLDMASATVSASIGLSARLTTDIHVPSGVVALAGGRQVGTLVGRVAAGTAGIADVTLKVGGYTVHTGADGTFSVTLAPGTWHVTLELGTLPIVYRIDGPLAHEVTVKAHQTSHVAFKAVATAGISGRVLLDSNNDGVADVPAAPGHGTVLLTEHTGLAQAMNVAADGTFEARGVAPGPAKVELGNLPLGFTVVGGPTRSLTLRSGAVATVTFLEAPASATAPTFSPTSLRVRGVAVEVDRVPPGAAPLVTVRIDGHADTVQLRVGRTRRALAHGTGVWTGRIPVPPSASPGVLDFEVVASSGTRTATRQGQVIIDPSAPLVETSLAPRIVPGEVMNVTVTAYLGASSVTVATPLGSAIDAAQAAPGRWKAAVPVPPDTGPGIYTARYQVTTSNGTSVRGTFQFRVSAR